VVKTVPFSVQFCEPDRRCGVRRAGPRVRGPGRHGRRCRGYRLVIFVLTPVLQTVLRIRDVYPGSEFFRPGFFISDSASRVKKIPADPVSASKNLSICNPSNCF
jgi:hypothetical protein